MSYTPGLAWKRSDGNPSSWPSAEEQRPSKTSNWHEQLDTTHPKVEMYENKVGEKLAQIAGIKG
jgi:hypothetical protein